MLQFTELFEPISESSPAGEDVTFSVEVDAINLARKYDDPSLDQGEWVVAIKEADWPFVYTKCSALLAKKTKDLRIAAWLVEAAAKTRQFEGMAAGFELLTLMCDRYWPELYPQMDGTDAEQRVGNLKWLLARSVQLVKEIPLTEGRETSFSWTDFEAARARANHALRTGESVKTSSSQPDLSVLETAKRKSSKRFYEALNASASHCQAMLAEFECALDERLGADGPSFSNLRDTLDTVAKTIERYGADVGVTTTAVVAAVAGNVDVAIPTPATGVSASAFSGAITHRTQALEQLRLVAEFFRSTEPHSPVAYLADKAATWGELPLHEWLKAVIKDPGALSSLEEMLGVKPDQS